jgi:NADH-quinone oxidoreductase subunit N
MSNLSDVWNPVLVFGAAGTLGLIAASITAARRWIPLGGLLAVSVALCGNQDWSQEGVSRTVCTAALVWGALLSVSQWTMRGLRSEWQAQARRAAQRLPLQFLLLAGLCLMTHARDLVTLFLGLQLIATGSRLLRSGEHRDGDNSMDDHSLFGWLFLFGCVLLVAVTGSTRLETIGEALHTSYVRREAVRGAIAGGGSRILVLAVILITSGLAGYAVCVPFHLSLVSRRANHASAVDQAGRGSPSVAEEDLIRLILLRSAAFIAWVRLWPLSITAVEGSARLLIGVLAVITALVPLVQANREPLLVKQWLLLAIAQGSWLLLAMAAWSFAGGVHDGNSGGVAFEWHLPDAASSAGLWLLLDGVALIGLDAVLQYLRGRDRPVTFQDELRGLLPTEPIAALCASVCLLSLVGAPLLAGFWSRLFLGMTALNVRGEWGPTHWLVPHDGLSLLTILIALSTVWTMSITFRSVQTMLFERPVGRPQPTGPVASLFAGVLAVILLVGCGLLPGPLCIWLGAPAARPPTEQQDSFDTTENRRDQVP